MTDFAIKVEGLGKSYLLQRSSSGKKYVALRDVIGDSLRGLFRKAPKGASEGRKEIFWALRDVGFTLGVGERLGTIGHNGAGKSTLLKILSRITDPTEGRVRIRGRVASLLEVGTGFHPELTGRENIFLNGAILGMRRAEIQRKFDEIVAFAEIERFLDTPVKRYSSGMYVRLAFAVAAHLEPEILVVDEVLAVGDAAFQKKCLSKMSSVAESGRTIVFVSHNLVAVQSFCDRLVWLDHGRVVAEGKPADLIPRYLKASSESTTVEKTWPANVAPGSDDVNLRRVAVRSAGKAGEPLTVHTPLVVEVDFQNGNANARIHVTLNLLNAHGLIAFETASLFDPRVAYDEGLGPGLYRSTCSIPGDLLSAGGYTVRVVIVRNMREVIVHESEVIGFEVGDSDTYRGGFLGTIQGVLRPKLDWTVRPLLATDSSTADASPDPHQVDRAETPG